MSDRYMNADACGIEPKHEGEEPTLEQWRARCRELWAENIKLRNTLYDARTLAHRLLKQIQRNPHP